MNSEQPLIELKKNACSCADNILSMFGKCDTLLEINQSKIKAPTDRLTINGLDSATDALPNCADVPNLNGTKSMCKASQWQA